MSFVAFSNGKIHGNNYIYRNHCQLISLYWCTLLLYFLPLFLYLQSSLSLKQGKSIPILYITFIVAMNCMCQIFCRLIKLISIAEVVVLFHVDLILIFNYFFFLLGANFTTIPILCGINSGVLQLITLVFYCWLATQAVLWYLKYYQHSKKQSLMCMAVLSWSKSCSTR